ncbi:HAD-like protein [Pholiota conissans]|uniref:HAD-like protein n=1 Tax=Pholiota conissans TaxID=109636 RepID=A0A9P5YZM4_9AGAR|nr:HAD-like protein [Pholiota conissans]
MLYVHICHRALFRDFDLIDQILFDMDGTLIDSTLGVLQAWKTFCGDYELGDSATIAHATHGRRLYDTLKEYCGITEEQRLLEEIDRFEDEVIEGGPAALPGAIELLSRLSSHQASSSKWTIVTSASNKYAPRALERSGVPLPERGIITSNDVAKGKPHPDPYLAGASLCQIETTRCLVVEDAISGLSAGRAAGYLTLAVCTSTERHILTQSHAKPDFIVADLTKVAIEIVDEKLHITMDQSH